MSDDWAWVGKLTRTNMLSEEWPDEVPEGVIQQGPTTEPLPKAVCRGIGEAEGPHSAYYNCLARRR